MELERKDQKFIQFAVGDEVENSADYIRKDDRRMGLHYEANTTHGLWREPLTIDQGKQGRSVRYALAACIYQQAFQIFWRKSKGTEEDRMWRSQRISDPLDNALCLDQEGIATALSYISYGEDLEDFDEAPTTPVMLNGKTLMVKDVLNRDFYITISIVKHQTKPRTEKKLVTQWGVKHVNTVMAYCTERDNMEKRHCVAVLGAYGDYIQTHNSWGHELQHQLLKFNDGRHLTFYNVMISKIRMGKDEDKGKDRRELEQWFKYDGELGKQYNYLMHTLVSQKPKGV